MESTTHEVQQVNTRPEPVRKPYHPPQVALYGDLAELTQQDPNPPLGKFLGLAGPMGDGSGLH